jgi:transposase-like protein
MKRIGKSLIAVQSELGTEEQCLAFLESLRWPNGVRCVECDHDGISKFVAKGRQRVNRKGETVRSPDRHLYQCLKCGQQFTAMAGTIFNDSHLPLQKWMQAVAIMCNARKGVSAVQLQRDMGVSYKTAWYLAHRIREAMELGNLTDEKMTGTVEADETYVGGKYDRRLKRARWDKEPVFGVIQRGARDKPSRVRAYHMPQVNRFNVYGRIKENVIADAELIITDDAHLYKSLGKHFNRHEIINHTAKQWVNGEVHTQGIENFWSLFKRGVIGSYHKVSIKHLSRYLSEFSFRFNNRKNEELFAVTVACLVFGIPLPYAKLIAPSENAPETSPSVEPF